MRLIKLQGSAGDDYRVQKWHEVAIADVMTSFVRIDVISVYTSGTNRFIEIEFYIGSSKRYTDM